MELIHTHRWIFMPKDKLVYKDIEAKFKSMMRLHQQIHDRIETVNASYKQKSNKYWKPRVFTEGGLVWVYLKKDLFPRKHKKKLMPQAEGPYKVVARVNDNA